MPWPLSQDYNEAIQSPEVNFTDPDLRRGQVVTNALGIPMPYAGNFADVYQLRCPDGSRWAVKCFTREVSGLRERYRAISAHLLQVRLPFSVEFAYLEQGILVAGQWYPVLKMQWVEGLALNDFVSRYLDKPAMLAGLLRVWVKMARFLLAARVAHGDLQHGNVLLVPGDGDTVSLKLIDYDGMWVPALADLPSGEAGHPSYQHPQRLREGAYGPQADRFPVLLIATALSALQATGAALWEKYNTGDNLLFSRQDLEAPSKSRLFYELLKTLGPAYRGIVEALIEAARKPMEQTPLLEGLLPEQPTAVTPPSSAPSIPTAVPVAPPPIRQTPPKVLEAARPAPLLPPPAAKRSHPEVRGVSPGIWLAAAGLLFAMVLPGIVWLAIASRPHQAPSGTALALNRTVVSTQRQEAPPQPPAATPDTHDRVALPNTLTPEPNPLPPEPPPSPRPPKPDEEVKNPTLTESPPPTAPTQPKEPERTEAQANNVESPTPDPRLLAYRRRIEALEKRAAANLNLEAQRALVRDTLGLVKQFVADDRYELLPRLSRFVREQAVLAKGDHPRQVEDCLTEAANLATEYEALRPVLQTLARQADDPDANLRAGQFYCLSKGTWDRGLPFLARGADDGLKSLAQKELTTPERVIVPGRVADAGYIREYSRIAAEPRYIGGRRELADSWWDYLQKAGSTASPRLREHVYHCYLTCLPGRDDKEQTEIDNRIQALAKLLPGLQDSFEELHTFGLNVANGILRLQPGQEVATKHLYSGPLEIDVVARVDARNLRIRAHRGGVLIFNWEGGDPPGGELRLHRPDGNDKGDYGPLAIGKRYPLTAHTWYHIRWRLHQQGMEVMVNNAVAYKDSQKNEMTGWEPVRVFAYDSPIEVRSITVKHIK